MSGSPEHKDGLIQGQVRGRGAGLNPGNRFEPVRLHVLGEHLDEIAIENPDGTRAVTHVYSDASKTVVNPVDSPDLGFHWTLNPYRGCEHGCIYCYARPTHEYLGFSCGLDFETRIVAKRDAAEVLRKTLDTPKWCGEPIMLSGVTDPYQPIESKLGITRECLKVLLDQRQPIWIITKNRLILRDSDLLAALHEHGLVHIAVSITTLDNSLAATMEPRASSPGARLDAVSKINAMGIPVTVMMAPMIPGLNDVEIPALLKAAADAGATSAGYILLRLPYQIKALFLEWLQRHFPDRAAHVEGLIRESRDGELNDSRAFVRFKGEGARALQIKQTFDLFKRRNGLDRKIPSLEPRPRKLPPQMSLFGR